MRAAHYAVSKTTDDVATALLCLFCLVVVIVARLGSIVGPSGAPNRAFALAPFGALLIGTAAHYAVTDDALKEARGAGAGRGCRRDVGGGWRCRES